MIWLFIKGGIYRDCVGYLENENICCVGVGVLDGEEKTCD